MVRFLIIGIVIAVAFTLYSLVDAAMTDHTRARGVSKPVWIVIIVLLPVIGALLWMFIGKGDAATVEAERSTVAPDDDPRFTTRPTMSNAEIDAHMRDLEARLRELDDEIFPGESAESPGPAGGDDTAPDAHPQRGNGEAGTNGPTENQEKER